MRNARISKTSNMGPLYSPNDTHRIVRRAGMGGVFGVAENPLRLGLTRDFVQL